MVRSWFDLVMLAAESQQAIALRLIRLAAGGPRARREATRMVSEKVEAAGKAARDLMMGGSTEKVVRRYRRKVRANVRRLSKP